MYVSRYPSLIFNARIYACAAAVLVSSSIEEILIRLQILIPETILVIIWAPAVTSDYFYKFIIRGTYQRRILFDTNRECAACFYNIPSVNVHLLCSQRIRIVFSTKSSSHTHTHTHNVRRCQQKYEIRETKYSRHFLYKWFEKI